MENSVPETWRRDLAQWHALDELPWIPIDGLPVANGLNGRLVSRADNDKGSQTWVVRVDEDWHEVFRAIGTLEFFVLEGEVSVGSATLGVGGFFGIPGNEQRHEISAPAESTFIAFWNPQFTTEHCYTDGLVHAVNSKDVDWQVARDSEGHGQAYRSLRVPDDEGASPSGFLRLLLFLPGYESPELEHHNTWEEMFYLAGDFMMPNRGNAGRGTIHTNPGYHKHGPYGSQWGSYMLWHTLEPYWTDFSAHLPGGKTFVADYLAHTPILSQPPTTDKWSQLQEAQEQFQRTRGAEALDTSSNS